MTLLLLSLRAEHLSSSHWASVVITGVCSVHHASLPQSLNVHAEEQAQAKSYGLLPALCCQHCTDRGLAQVSAKAVWLVRVGRKVSDQSSVFQTPLHVYQLFCNRPASRKCSFLKEPGCFIFYVTGNNESMFLLEMGDGK